MLQQQLYTIAMSFCWCFLGRCAVLVPHIDASHRAEKPKVSSSRRLVEWVPVAKCRSRAVPLLVSGEFASTPCSKRTRITSVHWAPTGHRTSTRRILVRKSSLNGIVVSHVGGDISMVPPVRIDCMSLGIRILLQCSENHAEGKVG